MKMITCSAWIAASPEAVWARIAALDWERWDPDLAALEGATRGFVEGGPAVFAMKNGRRFPARFCALEAPRHAEWTARGMGGLITASGVMELERGAGGTRFIYRFGMGGIVGAALMRLTGNHVRHAVQGCADGLARLMEEEAAAEAQDTDEAPRSVG